MSAEPLRWNIPLTQCSQKLIVVDVGEIANVEETQGTRLFWVFHLYTSIAHGSKSLIAGFGWKDTPMETLNGIIASMT